MVKFDGIERCIDIFEEIKIGNIKDYFIEMNSCVGGCLGGPCRNSDCPGFLEQKEKLNSYVKNAPISEKIGIEYDTRMNMDKQFRDKSWSYKIPSEVAIREILNKIGKFTQEKELNCGACGYGTCREKAIAVYNKKADIHMCLPYMREKAESTSNLIFNSTPNGIIALDEELIIQEVNISARKLLNIKEDEVIGKSVENILECEDFHNVNSPVDNIYNKKHHYEKQGVIVEQSILYVKEQQMVLIFMKDITKEVKKQQQMYSMRAETVEIAQKVIEKQMRVAQEIASLLGETTAETKVALTKLKKSIQTEIGEE